MEKELREFESLDRPILKKDGFILTQEEVKRLIYYNPDTGIFIWKERPVEMFEHCKNPSHAMNVWNGQNAGKISGHKFKNLNLYYIQIAFYGVKYRAHRIAWLYMTGSWPEYGIDHDDGDGTNNRWNNLRDVNQFVNQKNQKKHTSNTSGTTGVYLDKDSCKWRAEIKVNNKKINLGIFILKEDAIKARQEANIKYNFHINHGMR